MSQRRRRLTFWRRDEATLMAQVRSWARVLARRTGESREDLVQEGLLGAWCVPMRDIQHADDPLKLQLLAAWRAMGASVGLDLIELPPDLDLTHLEDNRCAA